jgi:hypothetical protein
VETQIAKASAIVEQTTPKPAKAAKK